MNLYQELTGIDGQKKLGYLYCLRHGRDPTGRKKDKHGRACPVFSPNNQHDWMPPADARRILNSAKIKKDTPVYIQDAVEIAAELHRRKHQGKVIVATNGACTTTKKICELLDIEYKEVLLPPAYLNQHLPNAVPLGNILPPAKDTPVRIRTTEIGFQRNRYGKNICSIKGITSTGAYVRTWVDPTYANAKYWLEIIDQPDVTWSFSHNRRLEKYTNVWDADYPPKNLKVVK